MGLNITFLGQAGLLFQSAISAWLIDPYLSNTIEELEGADYKVDSRLQQRLFEMIPANTKYYFVSHEHLDHLDPKTMLRVAEKIQGLKFFLPQSCAGIMTKEAPQLLSRASIVNEEWTSLEEGLSFRAVPAAHMALERDAQGLSRYLGYLWKYQGKTYYHSGDTNPHPEILALIAREKVDLAFLPINERNYFKEEKNIIGNMSSREACEFARVTGIKKWVPIHWDLFKNNSVTQEEFLAVVKHYYPDTPYHWLNAGESISL